MSKCTDEGNDDDCGQVSPMEVQYVFDEIDDWSGY